LIGLQPEQSAAKLVSMGFGGLRLGLAAMLAGAGPGAGQAQDRVKAEGTEFVLTTADGRSLRSADLVGATIKFAAASGQIEVRFQSVEEDRDATGGRVFLHRFTVSEKGGTPRDLCAPDAGGLGFPVPDGRGGFELTCTSGAVGKCIRWGYRPWEERPGGPPLQALHKACVYMMRADYGGDGSTSTRDGALVHVCDRFGIRPCERDAPLAFEAAWGRDGAICVARPRIAENMTLQQLAARYPRLAQHLGRSSCTEAGAMRDPAALLFNRSSG
jgi:hypothetical protein